MQWAMLQERNPDFREPESFMMDSGKHVLEEDTLSF